MFKTPLQERAERDIFSKDKEVAKDAMLVLLGEINRQLEMYRTTMPNQLILANVPLSGEIKIKD